MSASLEVPARLDLPSRMRDPAPERQREAMRHLAGQADWTGADWPGLVEVLMGLGRADIPLARLTEGHVDALRILAEAGLVPVPEALYGVWASRSGGTGLAGRPEAGRWRVAGRLLFASGAGVIDRALVTVWPGEHTHVLLDAEVAHWPFETGSWHTRAMEHSRSHQVQLNGPIAARRVGPQDFYLGRPGFFPGGVGVAAVWTGGAARVLDLLEAVLPGPGPSPCAEPDAGRATGAAERRERPESKRLRLGRARTDLAAAAALVRQAGLALHREADPQKNRTIATLCRAGVGASVRRLLEEVRTLAGPAGLAFQKELTRAVDDLALYVAQQSQDGDAGHLGAL